MAALAEAKVGDTRAGFGVLAFATLGLVAIFAALGGIYWDVTWHAMIGRESFWIPPHLFVYSGVGVLLFSALGGVAWAWRRAGSLRVALAGSVGAGFAVAALGPAVQMAAAPLDDAWHRAYGLDVTIWSPPHLTGIVGGMVAIYGLLGALGANLDGARGAAGSGASAGPARPLWRGVSGGEALGLLLFGAALSLSLFALGEFDFHLGGRDELFYPMLAGVLAAVPLMGAARYFGRPGAATAVALVYVLFRSSALLVVLAMGSYEHLTPPVFVLAPALAIDLALWLTAGRGVLPAALLAGPALVAGEWGLRVLLGAQGWEPLRVLASLAVVTLVVAAGALAGDRLGALMRPGPVAARRREDLGRRPGVAGGDSGDSVDALTSTPGPKDHGGSA